MRLMPNQTLFRPNISRIILILSIIFGQTLRYKYLLGSIQLNLDERLYGIRANALRLHAEFESQIDGGVPILISLTR